MRFMIVVKATRDSEADDGAQPARVEIGKLMAQASRVTAAADHVAYAGSGRNTRFLSKPRNDEKHPSHPPCHRRAVRPLQVSIPPQRPQREELGVTVIAQIEDPRKACCGVARLVPEAVVPLRRREVLNSSRD